MIETSTTPAWPTTLRSRLRDGRLMGTDGSVWMVRAVPMAPVVDAKSPRDALVAAEPLLAAYEELASMTSYTVARRAMARGAYRQVHLLLVNVPKFFEPDRNHPIAEDLRRSFGDRTTDRRVLLLAVRLVDKIGGKGGMKAAVDSVVETLVSGTTPLSDFDADHERVAAALDRAGLVEATADDIRLANAWWNHGDRPDTPMLVHADHLHFFTSAESVNIADRLGVEACHTWDEAGVPGQHAVTFASVSDLDLPFLDPASGRAAWIADLLDSGALVVSVRGNVEPGAITRAELRRQRKRYIDDINERAKSGKMERAEQQEMLGMLEGVEQMYAVGGHPPPTLAGASIVVGFDGQIGDIDQVLPNSPADLSVMLFRQPGAMAETMLCSAVRANPNLHDLPSQSVACSGVASLNLVGDSEGALIGLTERDRQPAYVSPTAASTADGLPMMLVAGATGSGKTMVLLNMADQYARMGRPVIIVDPKMDSDHSDVVLAAGGQVASLDELAAADGIFDPLRFAENKAVGIELAASMLMSINPWGLGRDNMEVPIQKALDYGIQMGATCTGEALKMADANPALGLPPGMISAVLDLAGISPMFRACVGMNPGSTGLRVADGITLIKVGGAHLELPQPGAPTTSINQRIAMVLVRMMVFGSAMALSGRFGVVMLDEAWTFMSDGGKSEMERLGRLARSQKVLPIMFTQRVTDATKAGLAGYISRGLILPIEDPEEAAAACELFKIEPTPGRMARITAKATKGASNVAGIAPNWDSMRSLRDPKTKQVLRGSVAIYADLAGRAIPVEMTLSADFLALASTNPDDIARRDAAKAEKARLLHEASTGLPDVAPDAGGAFLERIF